MPWHVEKSGSGSKPYKVVKDSDKKVVGSHKTETQAQQQLAALYANEPK